MATAVESEILRKISDLGLHVDRDSIHNRDNDEIHKAFHHLFVMYDSTWTWDVDSVQKSRKQILRFLRLLDLAHLVPRTDDLQLTSACVLRSLSAILLKLEAKYGRRLQQRARQCSSVLGGQKTPRSKARKVYGSTKSDATISTQPKPPSSTIQNLDYGIGDTLQTPEAKPDSVFHEASSTVVTLGSHVDTEHSHRCPITKRTPCQFMGTPVRLMVRPHKASILPDQGEVENVELLPMNPKIRPPCSSTKNLQLQCSTSHTPQRPDVKSDSILSTSSTVVTPGPHVDTEWKHSHGRSVISGTPCRINGTPVRLMVTPHKAPALPRPSTFNPGPLASMTGPLASTPGPLAATPGPLAATPGPLAATTGPLAATTGPLRPSPQNLTYTPKKLLMQGIPGDMEWKHSHGQSVISGTPCRINGTPVRLMVTPHKAPALPKPSTSTPGPLASMTGPLASTPGPLAATSGPLRPSPRKLTYTPKKLLIQGIPRRLPRITSEVTHVS